MAQFVPKAAYIHIPFCQQKCHYCDFPVIVDNRRNSPWRSQYLETLRREIQLTPSQAKPLTSVFFGGGTPSLLTPAELGQILQDLEQQFGFAEGVEISLEADPGTPGIHDLKDYQELGVNRLSLGVQSFVPKLLQISGRSHRVADIEIAIHKIKVCGWKNWSLDLIQGLPGQTLEQWQFSLEQAVQAQPKHISVYDLTLEPKTRFYRDYPEDSPNLPGEELTAQMYCLAHDFLEGHGFNHYEISNYAQPGYECRHNLTYWHNQPYYGFGLGATSYVDRVRFQRPKTIKAYQKWVEQYGTFSGVNMPDYPLSNKKDELLEGLMLGLRLKAGVNLTQLIQGFGGGLGERVREIVIGQLSRFEARGWVGHQGHQWYLIPPQGFLMSNTILSQIWSALDDGAFLDLSDELN
jgi:oxygen-independent coproporphyrinogen-3 oxidase